jgi:hypothetical protein
MNMQLYMYVFGMNNKKRIGKKSTRARETIEGEFGVVFGAKDSRIKLSRL